MAKTAIAKYGRRWTGGWSPLQIEMEIIRRGGSWTEGDGQVIGEGLLAHYLNARALIWPTRYRHRWTDLIYKEALKNKIALYVGPASSQKTSHISEIGLISYWANPIETAVLVSTMSVEKLDAAILGEIKMLWRMGRDLYPWLAGNPVDHKHCIVTDDVKEVGIRDMRQGIFGKSCFPSGTLIDTPSGKKPIENIRIGDWVVNANGIGRVRETISRTAEKLVRVHLSDGRWIDCTPDHPIFSQNGWIKAVDLETFDRVFSASETLSMLQRPIGRRIPEPQILFRRVSPSRVKCHLRIMQSRIPTMEAGFRSILQHGLRRAMGVSKHASIPQQENLRSLRQSNSKGACQQKVLFSAMPDATDSHALQEMRQSVHFQKRISEEKTIYFLQSCLRSEMEGASNLTEEQYAHSRRAFGVESFPKRIRLESSYSHRAFEKGWSSPLGQGRRGVSGDQAGYRNRRRNSSHSIFSRARQEKRCNFEGAWVDRVEVLEPGSDPRFTQSKGGYRVHNLEVGGHPSYSVNGVIVHNCYIGERYVGLGVYAGLKQKNIWFLADELQYMPATFLECLPNMLSNNLHVLGSGNPNHDFESQLAQAAEPPDGWSSVEDNEETSVWPIKLPGGVCVNLIGPDGPNFDFPENEPTHYPGLIDREFESRIIDGYGKFSPKYETQVMGRMKVGLATQRVITRQLCRLHHAHDVAVWESTNRTRVYAVDPAYGGGDRCVAGWGEFGNDDKGKVIFRIDPPKIIKIDLRLAGQPEDQIAETVKHDLQQLGIPASRAFYDSFGKGTVGYAFSKVFGNESPVPINAGEKPTTRPVRSDLFITNESSGGRRLERCDEHYSKFITEMWFSVHYAIKAEQIRELPEDVMAEGCWREYYDVSGGRIEVESKPDMKKRTGKSPDLFDWLVILLEGARRNGFVIGGLGSEIGKDDPDEEDWFDLEQEKYDKLIQSKLIQR